MAKYRLFAYVPVNFEVEADNPSEAVIKAFLHEPTWEEMQQDGDVTREVRVQVVDDLYLIEPDGYMASIEGYSKQGTNTPSCLK